MRLILLLLSELDVKTFLSILDEKKRKSKWDSLPQVTGTRPGVVNPTAVASLTVSATGTKSTVIPAVGNITKKSKSWGNPSHPVPSRGSVKKTDVYDELDESLQHTEFRNFCSYYENRVVLFYNLNRNV